MSVRAGREILAVPGPTNIPDEVLQAMHRPAVELYSKPLIALTDTLLRDIARLFGTGGRTYIYVANGHGAWEAALTNVLSRGDKILVLESGKFGVDWGDAAARLGVEVEVLKGDWRHAVQAAAVEARLRDDTAGSIKAVLAVQVDTSSSVLNDIAAIGKAIKAARHDALFMVDAVASLGCMPFAMDAWGVDVAMSGSQKGLMAPPGLSFVAASDRAITPTAKPACVPLLGLDRARRRFALRQIRRHAAGAYDVCDARRARHAVCRRARQRIPAPSPAGANRAPRHRGLEQARARWHSTSSSRGAFRHGDDRAGG